MVGRVRSLGLMGIRGYAVSVECALSQGLPHFDVVGLPDAAVKEARDRVRAACKSGGFRFPVSRLTVNLAPADTRKAGTLYDLPILLGILMATGQLSPLAEDQAFLGELSLTGELRPVTGVLPMALSAAALGIRRLYVPAENAPEAAFAENVEIYPVPNLGTLVSHLRGEELISPAVQPPLPESDRLLPDFSEVKGQQNVKRALEVAAAGGHNILLIGPPGAGKSMLAKRLPGILPEMTRQEMLETTQVHSVAGLTDSAHPIVSVRPFRSPHHTVSPVAMTGGSSNPRPGEISLAHNGVLFLDELPEFPSDVLEVMRQPLEDGVVTISRAAGSATFPSRFMLVCAMNPCKCGWYGHPSGRCTCTETAVRRYLGRISGPLLDRIDMIVEVPALEFSELRPARKGESSETVRQRVDQARRRQTARFGPEGVPCNAAMGVRELETWCSLDPAGEELLRRAFETMGLTARSHDRILRVARTIADLAGSEKILPQHVAEAVQYRTYQFPGTV